MKKLIKQIKIHAEAAKRESDVINHLDAIIGACGMLEQAIEHTELPEILLEFTRDFYLSKANEINRNAARLLAERHDRDRYQYTAAVLNELLNRIRKS